MAMTAQEAQLSPIAEAGALEPAAALFHSFGDPSRLVILLHLQLGEHRVVDLMAHLDLSQSTVSKHLTCLKDAGIVSVRPEGRASLYSLAHPEALVHVFAAAEKLLALTGAEVALCPVHGTETVARRGERRPDVGEG
ncbi:metalloregulator ArsR/SmtB family transcription factor [Microbacterium betulae]|uniref:Metalloregulator ArsR/SmtB family transcription factor n=1 Tax=Microbacterium betulae TaxID=2981139 RepID=A0AA97FHZ3_9MICO|nr:metalloregulator ArsR/SmtB family transcription factor [Microbacterium sp. AB]WOF21877.1 metalloregulator ArsR/SmtB family transcription factor [Microbacterium sp. AB]